MKSPISPERRFRAPTISPAALFLDAIGVAAGTSWEQVVRRASELFGRPIHMVIDPSGELRSVSGLWASTPDFGLVITRARDDEHYRLISQLHEVSHVLTAYAPAGLVQSLIGTSASTRIGSRIIRMCSAPEQDPRPEAQYVERFVESVALEIEHRMRAPWSETEVHL